MREILLALGRAVRSLGRGDVLWHLLWPSLAAALLWLVVGIYSWSGIIGAVVGWLEGFAPTREWLLGSEVGAAVTVVVIKFAVALAFLPLIYLTAALIVAVVALPMMLERVAMRDYRELELRRGGSNLGSAVNALVAGVLFVLVLLVSLPFWLIPGVGLVVSVALTAWLNQRAFGYDALMLHADREELVRLRSALRMPMLLLGGACALLAFVPFVNLLAPAYCGLAFVHFMLEALRRDRATRGGVVLDALTPGRS